MAARNADGTWTLTTPDGQMHVIDPNKEAAALMSPHDYETLENERWDAAARLHLASAAPPARHSTPSGAMH